LAGPRTPSNRMRAGPSPGAATMAPLPVSSARPRNRRAHPRKPSNTPQWQGEPSQVSEWPTATRGVVAVGALGAAAVMISPLTPWADGVIIFGLELFVPAVTVLLLWSSKHRGRNPAVSNVGAPRGAVLGGKSGRRPDTAPLVPRHARANAPRATARRGVPRPADRPAARRARAPITDCGRPIGVRAPLRRVGPHAAGQLQLARGCCPGRGAMDARSGRWCPAASATTPP
jgi:hypothetical protein